MKVSIVIPVYNVSAFIERCLLSVLNQTWQDLEIILVNDCTPDNSIEIVESILRTHLRHNIVQIITHEKNKGIAATRNTGIRNATGEYIYFLDSDDYLSDNSIELLAEKAIENKVDFVIGKYEMIGGDRFSTSLQLNTGILADNDSILSSFSRGEWYVMPWNKLVNRAFLEKSGLYFKEDIIHEDDLWSFMLACEAKNAYVVNEITYYYVIHSTSFMGRTTRRNLDSRVTIIQVLYDFIRLNEKFKEKRYIYILFETLKSKYFDRILYFERKDKAYHYLCYKKFKECTYLLPVPAIRRYHLEWDMNLRNIYYYLPDKIGYYYYKLFIKLAYIMLILSIKIDNLKMSGK